MPGANSAFPTGRIPAASDLLPVKAEPDPDLLAVWNSVNHTSRHELDLALPNSGKCRPGKWPKRRIRLGGGPGFSLCRRTERGNQLALSPTWRASGFLDAAAQGDQLFRQHEPGCGIRAERIAASFACVTSVIACFWTRWSLCASNRVLILSVTRNFLRPKDRLFPGISRRATPSCRRKLSLES